MNPSLLECTGNRIDIAALAACAALHADAEIERRSGRSGLIFKDDVHALADFCRHVLPDRRIIQRVVGCFRLERGIIRDGSGHLQDRHSNVTIHGQRGGQGHTCTGNALGERCVQAGALLAIVRGDLNGMGAVQDAQEAVGGAGLFKGQRSTACKAGAGGSGLSVQLFGDSQRVAVGIGNGIGEAEGCVLLSQTRGAGVDGRATLYLTVRIADVV